MNQVLIQGDKIVIQICKKVVSCIIKNYKYFSHGSFYKLSPHNGHFVAKYID